MFLIILGYKWVQAIIEIETGVKIKDEPKKPNLIKVKYRKK